MLEADYRCQLRLQRAAPKRLACSWLRAAIPSTVSHARGAAHLIQTAGEMDARKSTIKTVTAATLVLLAWGMCMAALALASPVRIGFVVDGPWAALEQFLATAKKEIVALNQGEFDVRFPPEKTIEADWDVVAIEQAVDSLLGDPDVDVVITVGVVASHAAATRPRLAKPVIAPFIADRRLQNLPYRDGRSGVHNLSYLDSATQIFDEIAVFRDLVPVDNLVVLVSGLILDAVPGFIEAVEHEAGSVGLDVGVVRVETTAAEALAGLSADTQGVFITPLMRLSDAEFQSLVDVLNQMKLPTFSYLGRSEVARGVLAGGAQEEDLPRRARRVALNVQRILLGEDPRDFPVAFADRTRLSINLDTARKIGFSPQWSFLADADLLHGERVSGLSRVTLYDAVHEAVAANLDLAAKAREVAAGEHDIGEARSRLLPQLDVSSTGVVIDDDRAAPATQAERTISGGLKLSQLIFSESALADVEVQRHLQAVREAELETLKLDIALDTAVAYLNLLRAKTLRRIERNNLELTRANLDISKTRQAVGAASPAEVYRWESQIATDKKSVVDSIASVQTAELELNRLLSRPLHDPVSTVDVGLEGAQLGPGPRGMLPYINNPRSYGVFADFLSKWGLRRSPELAQLAHAIAAQRRALSSAGRAFWMPTLALKSELSRRFSKEGAGSQGLAATSGAGSPLAGIFPDSDDTDWSVGVDVSLPLSTGGRRGAEFHRAREQLGELLVERKATAERVELRIRAALHAANASFQGIELARDAADAAAKNLEVVKDAYARGVVSIIDLLDAQNAALVAEQVAENAIYDFLTDFMNVSRAVSSFGFFTTEEETAELFVRLDAYFDAAGVAPDTR